MANAPEKIGRFDYGKGKVIYAEPPMFVSGQTNYIRADLVDELVKALEAIRRASALDDVVMSGPAASTSRFADIHQHADAALTRIKGDGK